MKQCPACGLGYPDEVAVCPFDDSPLEPGQPAPAGAEPASPTDQAEENDNAPEGFRCLGAFDPFEANRLLKQFSDTGIRFQIDRVERQMPTSRGIRKICLVEIYFHREDGQRVKEIFTADWKV